MNQWLPEAGISEVKREDEKTSIFRDQQGMALLVTIMTVSLLVAVTLQFHKTTWQQFLVANNYKVGIQLRAIAESGVNIVQALLQQDGEANQADSLLDSWATLDNESFAGLFPAGSLRLKVIDLSGLLQVNSLVQESAENSGNEGRNNTEAELRQVLLNLLISGSFLIEDEAEARGIIDSLVDWIDADDKESDLGAESSYYQSLTKPYSCRNGPVRYIEELLLVKGISPELLFGAVGKEALADYLTVYGDDGKININTAPLLLIKNLDTLIGDDSLERLDEYRRDPANEESFASLRWYRDIDGWPGDIVINTQLLTTSSRYFRISATGEFDTLTKSVAAIAERSVENEISLLGKKTE